MDARTFLAIADETPECRAAVLYGAHRAQATGGALLLLCVIEPMDNALWSSLGAAARAEAEQRARERLDQLSALALARTGVAPATLMREGEVRAEIGRLIEADPQIKILILGAGSGRDGPGPLVGALARGGLGLGRRALPVTVVPGALSDEEIAALAR